MTEELIDLCFWDLASGPPPIPAATAVQVRPVATRDDVVALQRIDSAVWGYRELDDREIDLRFQQLTPDSSSLSSASIRQGRRVPAWFPPTA